MKRSPKRSMAWRMRATSAMSIPLPTIMELLSILYLRLPIRNLSARDHTSKQPVAPVKQFAVNHASFCSKAVRPGRAGAVDMLHFMAVSDQPIGNQHTMATEIDSLRAHVGCT